MSSRPEWLTIPAPQPGELDRMQKLLADGQLHTVCEGADCPNIGECFANKTCTFMILGDTCTRNCRFCAVTHGRPQGLNLNEPMEVARTAKQLGLKHVVVTSVTRDDLPDGGAGQFVATIKSIRQLLRSTSIEVLIPDFQGSSESLMEVIKAAPDIINHNIETVARLYKEVRPQAKYERSLQLINRVHKHGKGILTKSGMMLGLGEREEEVIQAMQDLYDNGCDILTLGQYLRPSENHHPLVEYITPEQFQKLKEIGLDMGFHGVSAGPLVRSSYNAGRTFQAVQDKLEE